MENKIDGLIGLARDEQVEVGIRIESLSVLVDGLRLPMSGFCSPYTHALMEKNGFELFASLIDKIQASGDELANIAMVGAASIFQGCSNCRANVRDLKFLESIGNKMVSGEIHTIESTRAAVECIHACLRSDHYSFCLADPVPLVLLPALAAAVCTFSDDEIIVEGALTVLHRTCHFEPEPMLEWPGLLATVLRMISSGTNHSVIRAAADILGYFILCTMRQEDVERRERIILAEGFMGAMARCLREPKMSKPLAGSVGIILHGIEYGSDAHVDLLIEHPSSPITQLVIFLQDEVNKGSNSHIGENAWKLCAKIFKCFLAKPRPILLQNFLGCGALRPFIAFASVHKGERLFPGDDVDTLMGQILPPLLHLHPEYRNMAVEAGANDFVPVNAHSKT